MNTAIDLPVTSDHDLAHSIDMDNKNSLVGGVVYVVARDAGGVLDTGTAAGNIIVEYSPFNTTDDAEVWVGIAAVALSGGMAAIELPADRVAQRIRITDLGSTTPTDNVDVHFQRTVAPALSN